MRPLKFILVFLFLIQIVSGQNKTYTKKGNDTLPLAIVDKEPRFPGGSDSLRKFIQQNIHHPTNDNQLEGTVWVEFIVERNGKISTIKIKKSLSEYYDKEALRIISLMPDWSPGQKNGKIVRSIKQLPFKFSVD